MRNQVIALIGVLASGVVAFSSTTVISNLMAGVMLHVSRSFRNGDFIRVGDYFGRVAGRGLFNTEIETERRELVYLPNTFMVAHPVAVVRTSGTMVSASLSLGYDVHHSRIKGLPMSAAREVGLEDPFVEIVELDEVYAAVTIRCQRPAYRGQGHAFGALQFLRTILGTLNGEGIEIVSPTIMNQRRLADGMRIMPLEGNEVPDFETSKHEDIVFDKAEQAERQEKATLDLQNEICELETQSESAEGDEKRHIEVLIHTERAALASLRHDGRGAPERRRDGAEPTNTSDPKRSRA